MRAFLPILVSIVIWKTSFGGRNVSLLDVGCSGEKDDLESMDYVNLDFSISTNDSLSICSWIKPCRYHYHTDEIITLAYWNNKPFLGIRMHQESLIAMVNDCSLTYENLLPTWQWTHLCMVYTTLDIEMYVNSVKALPKEGNCKPNFNIIENFGLKLIVGSESSIHQSMSGYLADIRLYLKRLALEEVLRINKGNDYPPNYYNFKKSLSNVDGKTNLSELKTNNSVIMKIDCKQNKQANFASTDFSAINLAKTFSKDLHTHSLSTIQKVNSTTSKDYYLFQKNSTLLSAPNVTKNLSNNNLIKSSLIYSLGSSNKATQSAFMTPDENQKNVSLKRDETLTAASSKMSSTSEKTGVTNILNNSYFNKSIPIIKMPDHVTKNGHYTNSPIQSHDCFGTTNYSKSENTKELILTRIAKETIIGEDNNKTTTAIAYSDIDTDLLIMKKRPTMLLYYNVSTTYFKAYNMCSSLGGKVPLINSSNLADFRSHVAETESILQREINNFWVFAQTTNDRDCSTIDRFSSTTFSFIIKNCKTFAHVLCEIGTDVTYKILSSIYSGLLFYPSSFNPYEFQTKYTHKIAFDISLNQLSLNNIENPQNKLAVADITDFTSIMGRHLWKQNSNEQKSQMTFSSCKQNQFTCSNGQCINIYSACNRNRDCLDGSDEVFCNPAMPLPQFYDPSVASSYVSENNIVSVTLNLVLDSVLRTDMEKNIITVEFTMTATWTDERLRFKFLDNTDKALQEEDFKSYWLPSITISEATHKSRKAFHFPENPGKTTVAASSGASILQYESYEARVFSKNRTILKHSKTAKVHLNCRNNIYFFPFDTQACKSKLILERSYEYEARFSNLSFPSLNDKKMFSLSKVKEFNIYFPKDGTTNELEISLTLRRQFSTYFFNTFLPCILLEIIGFMAYIFPLEAFAERIAVTLSLLIVMADIFTQGNTFVPESAQPKLVDLWAFTHVAILFWFFIGQVTVNHLVYKQIKRQINSELRDFNTYLFMKVSAFPLQPYAVEKYFCNDERIPAIVDTAFVISSVLLYTVFLVAYFTYSMTANTFP